jgi:hypothetical protein
VVGYLADAREIICSCSWRGPEGMLGKHRVRNGLRVGQVR